MVFSSSCTSNTLVRTPGLAKFGAWRTALAKWLLPQPPRPPWSTTRGSFGSRTSARTLSVAMSRTMVPGGTLMTRAAPLLPLARPAPPGAPASA